MTLSTSLERFTEFPARSVKEDLQRQAENLRQAVATDMLETFCCQWQKTIERDEIGFGRLEDKGPSWLDIWRAAGAEILERAAEYAPIGRAFFRDASNRASLRVVDGLFGSVPDGLVMCLAARVPKVDSKTTLESLGVTAGDLKLKNVERAVHYALIYRSQTLSKLTV